MHDHDAFLTAECLLFEAGTGVSSGSLGTVAARFQEGWRVCVLKFLLAEQRRRKASSRIPAHSMCCEGGALRRIRGCHPIALNPRAPPRQALGLLIHICAQRYSSSPAQSGSSLCPPRSSTTTVMEATGSPPTGAVLCRQPHSWARSWRRESCSGRRCPTSEDPQTWHPSATPLPLASQSRDPFISHLCSLPLTLPYLFCFFGGSHLGMLRSFS